MRPGLRRFALTTHITLSVGWIGGVLAYLVLVVAAMTSEDPLTLRSAWVAMGLIGWNLIVPMALTSWLTGCVMSLGTPWGLLRHYWVLISLALTTVATLVLLLHMPTVSVFAGMAARADEAGIAALRAGLPGELLHAGVGLMILIGIEALNVYKPLGLTPYGRRSAPVVAARSGSPDDARPSHARVATSRTPRWAQIVAYHAVGIAVLGAIVHLLGGGLPGH